MKLEHTKNLLSALICVIFLSSCAWSDPVQVEDDFGNSVRHMIQQQKQIPESVQSPATYNPPGLDGDSAINSLDKYRDAQNKSTQNESLNSFELTE